MSRRRRHVESYRAETQAWVWVVWCGIFLSIVVLAT
jgi:hypothetical protein